MSEMCNDTEFRKTLESLDPMQQREIAAIFVSHVLPLSEDKRLDRVRVELRNVQIGPALPARLFSHHNLMTQRFPSF